MNAALLASIGNPMGRPAVTRKWEAAGRPVVQPARDEARRATCCVSIRQCTASDAQGVSARIQNVSDILRSGNYQSGQSPNACSLAKGPSHKHMISRPALVIHMGLQICSSTSLPKATPCCKSGLWTCSHIRQSLDNRPAENGKRWFIVYNGHHTFGTQGIWDTGTNLVVYGVCSRAVFLLLLRATLSRS